MQQQNTSTTNYADPFEFPKELCAKPLALIGFLGLDVVNNAVHKTIWCDFRTNDKMQRVPIQLKLLNNDALELPVLKPKRTSYEWYIPKGILKRNWMNKHLNEIPAVIVIFYELDWTDSNWNEKLIECSSRVQSVRAAVEGRNTRIVVVLIQQAVPLPAGEDITASERATALCASCELNSEHLFVLLPHDNHLVGYISRLENAFYDLAQGYYQQESRSIKMHRDHLNKTTHQYLYVRHEYKMGFLSELKQDHHTALKHYTYAYNNLQEVRIVDTNALEIRTIAGFINYKLCRVLFTLRLPRDAISQFKAHIDRYKARIGFKELAFEHHAWLSKQYKAFGDLFYEVIQMFPVVQTQHPGFYYQQAANQAILRKKLCYELCSPTAKYPTPDPLEGMNRLEHFGQRPWRAGRLSAEPPDPALEQAAIEALQWKERHCVDHSGMIIALFGSAMSHFKTNKCPRMRSAVVVQMANEYCLSNDYGKALTLLTHMLYDYRSEKWFSILTNLLKLSINCAQLTASVEEFITFSLESLANSIQFTEQYKKMIYDNLIRVFNKNIPEISIDSLTQLDIKVQQLWASVNFNEQSNKSFTIEMNNLTLFMQAKARFLMPTYPVHHQMEIEVLCRSCTCQHLQLSGGSLLINSPNYSVEIPIVDTTTATADEINQLFYFKPNETKKFMVKYKPKMLDAGKEIQITGILLHIGAEDGRRAILKYSSLGNEQFIDDTTHPEFQYLYSKTKYGSNEFFNVQPRNSTFIQQRKSNLELIIDHQPPALIGEWYPIVFNFHNAEQTVIHDLIIDFQFQARNCLFYSNYKNKTKMPTNYNLKQLNPNSKETIKLFIQTQEFDEITINLRINYFIQLDTVDSDEKCPCLKEETLTIRSVKPFDFLTKYYTRHFENIWQLYANERFVICPCVTNISPWPIVIHQVHFHPNEHLKILENIDSYIKNIVLGADNGECCDLYLAEISKLCKNKSLTELGEYTVHWKRKNGKTSTNISKFTILNTNSERLKEISLKIELDIAAYAFVLKPLDATYRITNNTNELVHLDYYMEASDAFMFSGHKQKQITVLPECEYKIHYTLFPLNAGKVFLPKLKISIPEYLKDQPDLAITANHLNDIITRDFNNEIYVLPQVRGNPNYNVEK